MLVSHCFYSVCILFSCVWLLFLRFHEISMRYPTLSQGGVFMEALTECNSAKNATLDASAAAHTAENEAKEIFLSANLR